MSTPTLDLNALLNFAQLIAIIGGVAVVFVKIGQKDQQLISLATAHGEHAAELKELRSITGDLVKMQATAQSDGSHLRDQLKDIHERLRYVEQRRDSVGT